VEFFAGVEARGCVMTSLREDPVRTTHDRAFERTVRDRPPGGDRRRSRLAAVIGVVALLLAGGVWWLLDSTVPASDYDDLVAELDATEEALVRAEIALSAQQSEVTAVRARVYDLVAAVEDAGRAGLLLGYFAGVDPEIVDPEQYESWAGVVELDTAVQAIGDPELTDLYWQHMGEGGFSPGSEELVLRLIELTIEPILEDR
jgi:hypothetical protein